MLWIKRNLFLVGFGLIAVALLGYSVFKLWSSMSLNKEVQSKVETTQQALESLMRRNPFPSRTNIAIARTELDRVRKATAAAGEFYAPVPFEPVTNQQAFRLLLDNTIYELQRKAEAAGVALPKKDYAFTFEAQKGSLQFASNSLPALPEQLAEIRALSSILFDAKINKLVNLKRWRVSVDDPPGSMDYHDLSPDSNDLTGVVTHPYEVTFNSFTAELATALEGLYKSTNAFVVKSFEVEPMPIAIATGDGSGAFQPSPSPAPAPAPPPAVPPPRPLPPAPGTPPPPGGAPAAPPASPGTAPVLRSPPAGPRAPAAPGRDNLQVVLNEQMLKITLQLEVVKRTR